MQRPLESPEVNAPSLRLPYFDLAKGVCNLLVVLYHLQEAYDVHLPSDRFLLLVRSRSITSFQVSSSRNMMG